MRTFALPAAVVLIGLIATPPAFARPPTVTTSPGYDRRLQESRQQPAQDKAMQPYLDDRRLPRKRKPRH